MRGGFLIRNPVLSRACFNSSRFNPDFPDTQKLNRVQGCKGGQFGEVCDVPRPVALRLVFPLFSKPAQVSTTSLANSDSVPGLAY